MLGRLAQGEHFRDAARAELQAVKRFGKQQLSTFMDEAAAGLAHGAMSTLEDARRMFGRADANRNGSLDVSELASLATQFGMSASAMMAQIDTNGDGSISEKEFMAWALPRLRERRTGSV